MKTANEQEFTMKRMWRTVVDNILNRSSDNDSSQPPTTTERRRSSGVVALHNNGPLLYGTTNLDQHQAMIATVLHICHLYQEQQKQQGCDDDFDCTTYDHVTSNGDALQTFSTNGCNDDYNISNNNIGNRSNNASNHRARNALSTLGFEFRRTTKSSIIDETNITEAATTSSISTKCTNNNEQEHQQQHDVITQLHHIQSNTQITTHNRQIYIADGNMYDAIANLCQDVAHEIMIECCALYWITICSNDGKNDYGISSSSSSSSSRLGGESKVQQNNNIIRTIVGTTNKDESKCNTNTTHNNIHNKDDDILLIITGKGKVRSGIFSRRHLLTTGIEPSTALPIIQMACERNMKVVILDPNARGDEVGMDTFEISIQTLFDEKSPATSINNNMNGSIYILAHSAGGGQLVRYLLSHRTSTLLSRIRCIVFTDSTHNVQWIKTKKLNCDQSLSSSQNNILLSLITSPSVALYFRSANKMYIDNWKSLKSGDECTIVDEYWVHRFGTIKTVWAGTTDHSLSNWTSLKVIWDHIDQIRMREREN